MGFNNGNNGFNNTTLSRLRLNTTQNQNHVASPQNNRIYLQKTTNNKSFLNMHYYLKEKGIQNNAFMLILFDPGLAGIDPHDRNLNQSMKARVLRECCYNYWYFLREVVRIPDQGGSGTRFELHRGNLALNFCLVYNLNIFLELPRQQGKTLAAVCRYLYLFNFATTNSEITFLNKKMEDSKLNLQRLKELREMLPPYLRMDQPFSKDNKKLKIPDTIEKLQHPVNRNIIRTAPSARNKIAAANLLRGRTIPILWADEYAFIPYNGIIYLNTVPAFKTASLNAKKNNAPYGILITTTPGLLTTDEGVEAFELRNNAVEFDEKWYDMSYRQIMDIIDANTKTNFVSIKYNYQQLGRSEEWFNEICKDMLFKWDDIRREVLLEWSTSSENSPFTKEELEAVLRLVREPVTSIYLLNKYKWNIYDTIESRNNMPKYPPILGVDVSGGYKKDSSCITAIDSNTTKVFADFNCNHISTHDLAAVIYEVVTKYLPNAIVNVERNGGYGASVLSKLINSTIKKNLYFEVKERIIEETNDGPRVIRKKQNAKVYGLDSSKSIRELLIQILRERMDHHKDKFVSKRLYHELSGLEVKRSGKIEHSSTTHDDQVFSYLMALYVWYEGKNIKENFGINKSTIQTDESIDEVIYGLEEKFGSIIEEITHMTKDETELDLQLKDLEKNKGMLYNEWMKAEEEKDAEALKNLLGTRLGKIAYMTTYKVPEEEIPIDSHTTNIPNSVFMSFYNDND